MHVLARPRPPLSPPNRLEREHWSEQHERSPTCTSPLDAHVRLAIVLLAALSSGCDGAPSVTVAGAYFPAWLVCALIGALAAVLARAIFVATGLAQALPLQLLVCVSAGVLCGAVAWVLWIRL
jgi:YtcA family